MSDSQIPLRLSVFRKKFTSHTFFIHIHPASSRHFSPLFIKLTSRCIDMEVEWCNVVEKLSIIHLDDFSWSPDEIYFLIQHLRACESVWKEFHKSFALCVIALWQLPLVKIASAREQSQKWENIFGNNVFPDLPLAPRAKGAFMLFDRKSCHSHSTFFDGMIMEYCASNNYEFKRTWKRFLCIAELKLNLHGKLFWI